MAPSTALDFLTQMEMEQKAWSERDVVSPSVISETTFKASGHHSISSPWSVQEAILTTAPPSHHSDEQIERAENHCQNELDRDLSLPHAESPNARASQSVVQANQAAEEHSPPLHDDPFGKLYAAADELLFEGFRLAIVYQALDIRYLNESNTPYSELNTAKHIVMVVRDDSELEEHSTALAPDDARGPQYNRNSSRQDETYGESPDDSDTNSGFSYVRGKQMVSTEKWEYWQRVFADRHRQEEWEKGLPKLADLRNLSIDNEFDFRKAFKPYFFQAIEVGASAIDLLDLAKAAIDFNRQNKARTMTDKDTWQLLFNIIANLLVHGAKPLYKTVEAIRELSAKEALAEKSPRSGEVNQPSSPAESLGVAQDEEALGRLTQSMCSWTAEDNNSPLIRVYSYFDKLQTVYQFDEMTKPENEERTRKLLERKGIPVGEGKKKIATAILRYICRQSCKEKVRTTKRDLSAKISSLTAKISNLRPVCALVEAFGQGVLLLLGGNPRKFLSMAGRGPAKKATYLRHGRLRDVAMSLKEADRNEHHGQLRALFDDLHEKVLRLALHFREHKNIDGWLIDAHDGGETEFDEMEIGARIPFVLGRIKSMSACSGDISAQAGERPLKRRMSSGGIEQAAEGGQYTNKRTKLILDFGVILLGRNGDKLAAVATILPTAGNTSAATLGGYRTEQRQPPTLPYSPPSTQLQGRQLGKLAPFRPFRRLFGQPHPQHRQSLLRYLIPHAARERYRERLLDFRLDTLPYYKHRLQSRIYRYILSSQQRRLSKTRWVDHITRAAQNSRRLLFGPQPGPTQQGHHQHQHRKTLGWRGNALSKTIGPGDKTRGGNMAQSGSGGSGYGYSYGYGYGGSDPGQYAEREPGARRKKLAGFAKSVYQAGVATASEIRNQYDNTRIRGVVDVDDSTYKVSIPGSFPDVSIVSKGDEQMVLFPSYAARHVRQFRDGDRQPSAHVEGERREADLSEEDYWRNEWARMEDKKAVVDVDVRGWVYAPHKGPMTRKNRVLIGLARRLSGVPQQTHQPSGQSESLRTGYDAREDAREQQKIDKEAEMIERRGQAEKEAAVKGGYSETPKEEDSEGEGPGTSLRSRSASGSATPMSGASSPRLSARPANNSGAPVELTEAELAVANANLMARLGPFLTTPLVELPVTLFFYNDDQSVSRTVMTNDAGHFYIRAALDFVPTHVRVLANEKLSAVEPVDIIGDDGVSLISDIDDTIKKSSISMGAREIFRNTFIRDLKDLTVAGVREWYGELHKMGVRFHYCSNSPWQLFPVIATFFGLAGLPPGSLHLKQYSGMLQGIFEPVAERKKGTLEKILRDFPRRRFILVGDSGEADLEVYTDLALANPGRILAIFIRDVTTPEQTGYFDSAFNGPAPAGPSSRLQPVNAHSRKDSGSDHPDRRPALPSRTATAAARQESSAEEDLIDFSDEPQNMTAKEEHNLDKSRGVPSSSATSQDQATRKKPPPPRPSKPAALRSESSGSLKTETPANHGGPATMGKKPAPSQTRSATAHPLAQTQNLSAQSLGKSPTLPPRKPSNGSNSNASSIKSNNNSSNAPSPPASYPTSSSKQPPPPPPPRRRGTPSLINSSPRQRALRRATSNSDIDSLNLESSAAMSTPRPGPPNRTGTASTFDSILGSTTGHTMQQGGQNLPVNKKLELWLRRLERAHETLEREGVRLYTWRKGEDVVSEAVGIVKEATKNTKGTDNARR